MKLPCRRLWLWLCLAVTVPLPRAAAEDADPPALAIHRDVTYVARDELSLLADVYVPPGAGPFPGVLMIHGGAWASGGKWQMAQHARTVAEAGFTVVAINYRLAPRFKFPAQLEDCRAALEWMMNPPADYKIDAQRLATYGYSAGGHLACLVALDRDDDPSGTRSAPHCIQAVIAGGAPCDFQAVPPASRTFHFLLGGTRAERPQAYRAASPLAFASHNDPPVWFFHGDRDELVPLASPRSLQQRLQELGVPTNLYLVEDKGHLGAFFDRTAQQKAVEFLREQISGVR